jgi:hypothetical protein
MIGFDRLRRAVGAEQFTAVFLTVTYVLLGLGFLIFSPTVGGVLLAVGLATFAVFLLVARSTRSGPVRTPEPVRDLPRRRFPARSDP